MRIYLFFSKYFIIFTVMVLTTSCIGVGFVKEANKVYNGHFIPKKEAGYIEIEFPITRSVNYIEPNIELVSKADLLKKWGKPNKIISNDDIDKWIYTRELALNGFIIAAIIPIPILLPVGKRNTEIFFKDDKVEILLYKEGKVNFMGCWLPIKAGCKKFD